MYARKSTQAREIRHILHNKYIELFKLLGVKPPKYAHIAPISKLENGNHRKLSKRKDPEAAVSYYSQLGMNCVPLSF